MSFILFPNFGFPDFIVRFLDSILKYMKKTTTAPSTLKWIMAVLAALTAALVFAMPYISLPVLFKEISTDLNLSLVQVGWIWGFTSLTGMFVGLFGGSVGDRVGTRRSIIFICLLTGLFGALRALSPNFWGFMATTFLMGLFQPALPPILHKVVSEWFEKEQLGLANGMISVGMALGLTLGSLVSASFLSPLLGGWRNVIIFYGVLAILVGAVWYLLNPQGQRERSSQLVPLQESLAKVVRLPNIWLIGIGALGVTGCVNGFSGYLPTYLKESGWDAGRADQALALFYFMSLVGVVPIAMWSDRVGNRKIFLVVTSLILGLGIGALCFVTGAPIWILVAVAGIVFDGYMAVLMTAVIEVRGVGPQLAGTAVGFLGFIRNFGGTISPPIGNSLADTSASLPFLFWGAMGIFAVIVYARLKTD